MPPIAKFATCLLVIAFVCTVDALQCYTCNGCSGGTLGEAQECNETYSIGPMCYRQIVQGSSTLEYAGCIDLCVIGPSGISTIEWTDCCTNDLCNLAVATLNSKFVLALGATLSILGLAYR